jgi:predicted nucleic acid-binding protein
MIWLLDTTAFSDLMRQHPKMLARLATLPSTDQVVICSIVRGEILHGIQRLPPGRRRQELETRAASYFALLPCEPVPAAAGNSYAALKLECQQKGLVLNENDLWIAATASALGAVLVSRDGDFQRITALTVEDWSV